MKIKNGDLLVPISEEAKKTWGRGIVTEADRLDFPVAHLVFWFSHNRKIVIEEQLLFGHFEIVTEERSVR